MTQPPDDSLERIRIFRPEEDVDDLDDTDAEREEKPSLDEVIATLRQGSYPRSTLVGLSDLSVREGLRFGDAWKTVDVAVRRAVVMELNDLAEERFDYVFGRALMVMLDDEDASVRQHAIAGLWGYEDSRLAERLQRLMGDDASEDVRATAARGLGWFVEQAELGSIDRSVGDAAFGALLAVLENETESMHVRARALESASARAGNETVRAYIQRFYDEDETGFRATAIFAMGQTSDRSFLPTILNETATDDAEIRFEAARAAGHIGDSSALPVLADLADDEDAEVRHAAINAIGEIGGRAAVRYLARIAESAPEADRELIEEAMEEASILTDPLLLEEDET